MEFPSNSHNLVGQKPAKAEAPPKIVEKVVSGEVRQRQKSMGRRFKTLLFGGEAKNAVGYVIGDVLLPAFKNMVVDATSKGMERVVYGDSAPRRRPNESRGPRVSYNTPVSRYGSNRPGMLPDQPPLSRTPRREANEIILSTRNEASTVLERLCDIVDKYDVASVADLHDLVGLPTTYVDNKWGWTALVDSDIQQIREGFLLNLPPVEPI